MSLLISAKADNPDKGSEEKNQKLISLSGEVEYEYYPWREGVPNNEQLLMARELISGKDSMTRIIPGGRFELNVVPGSYDITVVSSLGEVLTLLLPEVTNSRNDLKVNFYSTVVSKYVKSKIKNSAYELRQKDIENYFKEAEVFFEMAENVKQSHVPSYLRNIRERVIKKEVDAAVDQQKNYLAQRELEWWQMIRLRDAEAVKKEWYKIKKSNTAFSLEEKSDNINRTRMIDEDNDEDNVVSTKKDRTTQLRSRLEQLSTQDVEPEDKSISRSQSIEKVNSIVENDEKKSYNSESISKSESLVKIETSLKRSSDESKEQKNKREPMSVFEQEEEIKGLDNKEDQQVNESSSKKDIIIEFKGRRAKRKPIMGSTPFVIRR